MIFRHIYHSAYEVLTEDYQLIFDYFKGDINLREDKIKLFFVSHSHGDHYHRKIHDMADQLILWKGIPYRDEKTYALDIDEHLEFPGIHIHTSGSTDEGLSFEVEVQGKRFIHAGDLNNWVWPEDTPQEREQMEAEFYSYLSLFKKEPDALLFPVDYRLKEYYDLGVNQAVDFLRPKLLFPLHFREHPEILPLYKECIKEKVRMILPEEMPYHLE